MARIPWIAMFSQTGAEIANISEQLNHWPDLIIVNERNIERTIDSRLQGKNLVFVSNKPTEQELEVLWTRYTSPMITLHGWLRIIPDRLCNIYQIYNGHPGLINKYPELKGKDPQERAWVDMHKYDIVGSVVHRVVEEVDAGEINTYSEISTANILTIDEMYSALRSTSLIAWSSFLKERLYNEV